MQPETTSQRLGLLRVTSIVALYIVLIFLPKTPYGQSADSRERRAQPQEPRGNRASPSLVSLAEQFRRAHNLKQYSGAEVALLQSLSQGIMEIDVSHSQRPTKSQPIQAELLSWLLRDHAVLSIPSSGLRITRAVIAGNLTLSGVTQVSPLALLASRIDGNLNIDDANFYELSLERTQVQVLYGPGARIGRNLDLDGFVARQS